MPRYLTVADLAGVIPPQMLADLADPVAVDRALEAAERAVAAHVERIAEEAWIAWCERYWARRGALLA